MKLLLILLILVVGTEAQFQIAKVDSLLDALKYLVKFGYLKDLKEVASLLNPTSTFTSFDPFNPAVSASKMAFSKFQQYAKLPVTGDFDSDTKAKMNTPRCGNKDLLQVGIPLNVNTLLRKKRYVAGVFKWEKREVSYRVDKYSESGFPQIVTSLEVDRAFWLWGNVTNIHFRKSESPDVDIHMRFARGAHGDLEPFDGRGITLAHAYPPGVGIGGDIHFDDDEEWTSEDYEGTNFFHVVVHELGHALGLRHSDIEEAIMYAFVRSYEPGLQLHPDDVEGIQSMYGPPVGGGGDSSSSSTTSTTTEEPVVTTTTSSSTPTSTTEERRIAVETTTSRTTSTTTTRTTTTTPTPTDRPFTADEPDLCKTTKIDAITTLADGTIWAFRGNYAFLIDPKGKGVLSKHTDRIPYVFYSVPGPIDAALTYEGKTYLFKGGQYLRFHNRKLEGGFPRSIAEDFPGIPKDNLDAGFTWSDGTMYFFKGDSYWNFDPKSDPPVPPNYPLPISQWYGLPSKDIDAAFRIPNGPTYFFQGDSYWLFDDEDFQVADTDPPYPYSAKVMWYGCTPYRPSQNELRRGFIRKALDAVAGVVKGVVGVVDWKVKKVTGWLG